MAADCPSAGYDEGCRPARTHRELLLDAADGDPSAHPADAAPRGAASSTSPADAPHGRRRRRPAWERRLTTDATAHDPAGRDDPSPGTPRRGAPTRHRSTRGEQPHLPTAADRRHTAPQAAQERPRRLFGAISALCDNEPPTERLRRAGGRVPPPHRGCRHRSVAGRPNPPSTVAVLREWHGAQSDWSQRRSSGSVTPRSMSCFRLMAWSATVAGRPHWHSGCCRSCRARIRRHVVVE